MIIIKLNDVWSQRLIKSLPQLIIYHLLKLLTFYFNPETTIFITSFMIVHPSHKNLLKVLKIDFQLKTTKIA